MMARPFKFIPVWALYTGLFLLIMIAAGTVGWWRNVDWWFYRHLPVGENSAGLHDDIVIVDIPYNNNNEIFRQTVASLMADLVRNNHDVPKAVALDVYFTNDDRGMKQLVEAVDRLRKSRVAVFAGVDPRHENSGDLDPNFMGRHYENLYSAHLDEFGHTLFQRHTYLHTPFLALGRNSCIIPSLATVVAERIYGCNINALGEIQLVHPVSLKEMEEHTFSFNDNWSRFAHAGKPQLIPRPSFLNKLVLVGCLKHDIDPDSGIPGPMFIAWELNDYIQPTAAYVRYRVVPPVLHLISILVSIFATLIAFVSLIRTGRRISIRPTQLALVSGAVGFLVTVASIGALLLTKTVNPYVTMPSFAALLSSVLAGRYWHGVLGERAFMKRKDEWLAPPAHEYDIFISYTHEPENAEWVRKNVFEPLSAARRFDGKKLRIFFDTESITVGESWHRKITRSIYLSRYFLPVYSFDYFERDYCRYEMDHAAEINVHNQGFVMPVVHELPEIPEEYRLIQYSDARNASAFLDDIIRKLTEYKTAK